MERQGRCAVGATVDRIDDDGVKKAGMAVGAVLEVARAGCEVCSRPLYFRVGEVEEESPLGGLNCAWENA